MRIATMWGIWDTLANRLATDQYGHLKLYSKESSARRRAQSDNNAVFPKMDRYAIIVVDATVDVVWGKPNYIEVTKAGDAS
jgi:hypothetical protein